MKSIFKTRIIYLKEISLPSNLEKPFPDKKKEMALLRL